MVRGQEAKSLLRLLTSNHSSNSLHRNLSLQTLNPLLLPTLDHSPVLLLRAVNPNAGSFHFFPHSEPPDSPAPLSSASICLHMPPRSRRRVGAPVPSNIPPPPPYLLPEIVRHILVLLSESILAEAHEIDTDTGRTTLFRLNGLTKPSSSAPSCRKRGGTRPSLSFTDPLRPLAQETGHLLVAALDAQPERLASIRTVDAWVPHRNVVLNDWMETRCPSDDELLKEYWKIAPFDSRLEDGDDGEEMFWEHGINERRHELAKEVLEKRSE